MPRLKHEKERLYHQNAAKNNLELARCMAKCTIPIAGPIWALLTEMKPMGMSEGAVDDESPEDVIDHLISNLQNTQ